MKYRRHWGYQLTCSAPGVNTAGGDVRSVADLIASSFTVAFSWHDQALCAQTDPELFFPDHEPGAEVFSICQSCPVRLLCLEDALSHPRWDQHGSHGIWGGMTTAGRKRLLKQHGGDVAAALAEAA